jgi:hypothetical protein
MEATALSAALTRWVAPHPAWTLNPEWPEEVAFATWESRTRSFSSTRSCGTTLIPLRGSRLIGPSRRRVDPLWCCLPLHGMSAAFEPSPLGTTRPFGYIREGVLALQT